MEQVDVAIIGAGTAGLVARRQALSHGAKRVLLIEGGPYGTTCARVGCMPSKLLIAAAHTAEAVRGAPAFGVHAGEPRIDGPAVMQRVRSERDRFAGFVVEASEKIPEDQRLRGWARFVSPHRLEVETAEGRVEVEAETIVIATGSKPHLPPPLRELGPRVLTTDAVFELETVPASIAVVGAGVIGLELGQAMHQLGARTTLLDISTRMPLLTSEAMQAEAKQLFSERLDLRLGISGLEANNLGDEGIELSWKDADGSPQRASFEYVLAAAGRRPQLPRLELANAGLELDERGMPVAWDHRTAQIADTHIFLAGDANADRPLLHEAASEGRIAGTNAALYPDVRGHARHESLGIVFSDPNIAIVGTIPGPEGEGVDWECGEVDYGNQGRARVMNKNAGRVRIYANHECGTLLGAEMIGPGVEHMAHLLAWAVEQKVTAQRALTFPFYHPVLEEGLRTALANLARKLKMGQKPRPLDCGPGA